MELNEKQKKILEFLEKEELATTKIAFLISANLYQAEEYLNELEKEGFIIKKLRNNATYWVLKEGISTQ